MRNGTSIFDVRPRLTLISSTTTTSTTTIKKTSSILNIHYQIDKYAKINHWNHVHGRKDREREKNTHHLHTDQMKQCIYAVAYKLINWRRFIWWFIVVLDEYLRCIAHKSGYLKWLNIIKISRCNWYVNESSCADSQQM